MDRRFFPHVEYNFNVLKDKPIIDISYNYNYHKFLSFIDAECSGRTKDGITYSSNYPNLLYNVSIRPVACPLVTFDEVGSYNKPKQSYLAK